MELHGCCYNCGEDDGHISRNCPNPTKCVHCGGFNHISRGCTRPRPRSSSPVEARPSPALRPRPPSPAVADLQFPPLPSRIPSPPARLPPPPPGTVRVGLLWSQVVRAESSGSVAGPVFSVSFAPAASLVPPVASRYVADDQMDCCFLEAGPDIRVLEEELSRAVVVIVVGSRQAADLAAAAAAIVEKFELRPLDMSIRSYYPQDFLVLCHSVELRNQILRRGRAGTPLFDLLFSPWSRLSGATGISMPFFVSLILHGVPANS